MLGSHIRTPFVAANWKMHKTVKEATEYTCSFAPLIDDVDDVDIVIAPPFLALPALVEATAHSQVRIAAQNVHADRQGAFTGEVSLNMLRTSGVTLAIIGHSERRQLFGETDTDVNAKTRATVDAGLTPIVCIGETLEEREANRTFDVLDRQIRKGLAGLSPEQIAALVVAYEPVWAIGTGRNATPDQANAAHQHIRAQLASQFGDTAATACRVIYGGSVKPDNAGELMTQPDVDGALVGGASLDPSSFAAIVASSRPLTV
jgi:triosephosphate isomerase